MRGVRTNSEAPVRSETANVINIFEPALISEVHNTDQIGYACTSSSNQGNAQTLSLSQRPGGTSDSSDSVEVTGRQDSR